MWVSFCRAQILNLEECFVLYLKGVIESEGLGVVAGIVVGVGCIDCCQVYVLGGTL